MLALEAPERGDGPRYDLDDWFMLVGRALARALATRHNDTNMHWAGALGWAVCLSLFWLLGMACVAGDRTAQGHGQTRENSTPNGTCTFDGCFFCEPAAGRDFVFGRRVLLVLAAGRSSRVAGNKKYGWGGLWDG